MASFNRVAVLKPAQTQLSFTQSSFMAAAFTPLRLFFEIEDISDCVVITESFSVLLFPVVQVLSEFIDPGRIKMIQANLVN
jgi:hypothetical protein